MLIPAPMSNNATTGIPFACTLYRIGLESSVSALLTRISFTSFYSHSESECSKAWHDSLISSSVSCGTCESWLSSLSKKALLIPMCLLSANLQSLLTILFLISWHFSWYLLFSFDISCTEKCNVGLHSGNISVLPHPCFYSPHTYMACLVAVCPPVAGFRGKVDVYCDLVSGTCLSRCVTVPLADTGGNLCLWWPALVMLMDLSLLLGYSYCSSCCFLGFGSASRYWQHLVCHFLSGCCCFHLVAMFM